MFYTDENGKFRRPKELRDPPTVTERFKNNAYWNKRRLTYMGNQLFFDQKISTNINEDLGIFAEGLMHYLLTISLIPSQRKISKNNVEIDIVIPDILTLNSSPKDSLIILFPKSKNENLIKKRISELETIQPIKENIWVVLDHNLISNYRTYLIQNKDNTLNKILDDINKFCSSRKQNKLKIMKS